MLRKFIIAWFALLPMLVGMGCSQEEPISEKEESRQWTRTPETLGQDIVEKRISQEEAIQRGLYHIPNEELMTPERILPKRRTVVDMRAGTPDSVVVDLLTPANLRWLKLDFKEMPCSVEGDTVFKAYDMWIYKAFTIDFGPIIAQSLSPTQVKIVRKTEVLPDQKPVEVELERCCLDMIPYEYGAHATLIVELTDTPADSKDTEDNHYITVEQADQLGLYHMPFDCDGFHAPIFEGGKKTVELSKTIGYVTAELSSPAQIYTNMAIPTFWWPIDGIRYLDIDQEEWIFTPSESIIWQLHLQMKDPLHITVSLSDGVDYPIGSTAMIELSRDELGYVPEAGLTLGQLFIKIVE